MSHLSAVANMHPPGRIHRCMYTRCHRGGAKSLNLCRRFLSKGINKLIRVCVMYICMYVYMYICFYIGMYKYSMHVPVVVYVV